METRSVVGVFDPYKHEKIIQRGSALQLDEPTAKKTEKEKTQFFTKQELKTKRQLKTYEQKDSEPLFKFAKGKTSYNPEIPINPRYSLGKGKETKIPNFDYLTRRAIEVFE